MEIILIILFVLTTGAGAGASIFLMTKNKQMKKALSDTKTIELSEEEAIEKASSKAKNIIYEARNEALELKTKTDQKIKERFTELEEEEKRIDEKDRKIIDRIKQVEEKENLAERERTKYEELKKKATEIFNSLNSKLEKIASMTKDQAKEELFANLEKELKTDIARKIKEAEIEAERGADEKSKWILVDAMQKASTDYVAETTTTSIEIGSEELKGKIIGKEGRNIRTFEKMTGVDLIVDEAPETVTLSCFDPVRREVASIALQKLLKDGRVHPGTIEATIQKVKENIGKEIKQTGEKMAYDAGFPDMPIEVIRLLGRFKYRYSYGQNLIKHTLEMINLGEALANEIGADASLVKKACLLHDIGKVLVHEIEGKPHHHISGDIVRKYFNDEKLANAVEAHHGDIESKSVEAEIIKIADAISGARPGARRDNYEEYIKRIRALEEIAKKNKEVKEAYAIHAGREIRVILEPKESSDADAKIIARKVAKEIEETQQYPGSVKVTVIRELRIEQEAK